MHTTFKTRHKVIEERYPLVQARDAPAYPPALNTVSRHRILAAEVAPPTTHAVTPNKHTP